MARSAQEKGVEPPSEAGVRRAMENLVYCDASQPGITRRRTGRGWAYWDADGNRITNRDEIERLNAIGLPPAYESAWFSADPESHILAIGIDARGRKQYRYHPQFRAARDSQKFDACARFGRLLPLVRKRIESDLNSRKLSRERAIASIVRLLDTGGIRIGNEAYAQANKSFGATTLRMRHAKLEGSVLKLRFKAKSGKLREMRITDRNLTRFVRRMQDLPGQHLFQYLDGAGQPCPIGSGDVNDYLCQTMGEHFTAKHFRTWRASADAFELLARADRQLSLKDLTAEVASRLGNTPAIARKSYIHPAVLALVGGQATWRSSLKLPRPTRWLSSYERAFIAFLEQGPGAAELIAA